MVLLLNLAVVQIFEEKNKIAVHRISSSLLYICLVLHDCAVKYLSDVTDRIRPLLMSFDRMLATWSATRGV